MSDQALRREHYQAEKKRRWKGDVLPRRDGKPCRDAKSLGRAVAMHAECGEWSRVAEVVQAAYEAANGNGAFDRIPVVDLEISPKLIEALERQGFLYADQISRLAADRLIEIPGVGMMSALRIFKALRKVGLK